MKDNFSKDWEGEEANGFRMIQLHYIYCALFQSLGREDSPGEGNGNPLQYSCLENSIDRRAWWATVHGVEESNFKLQTVFFSK